MLRAYSYSGDHEHLADHDQLREEFAALIGAQDWGDQPWSSTWVRRLLDTREEIRITRESAEAAGFQDVLDICPPVPEILLWLLYGDE